MSKVILSSPVIFVYVYDDSHAYKILDRHWQRVDVCRLVLEFLFLFGVYSIKKKEFLFFPLCLFLFSFFISFPSSDDDDVHTINYAMKRKKEEEEELRMCFWQIYERENKQRNRRNFSSRRKDDARLIRQHSSST